MPRDPSIRILAQGDGWVIVAKPPRVPVHRGRTLPAGYAMLQRVRDLVGAHVWPVHRLDHPASGCLLFSTDRRRTGALHAALRHADARKVYVALVRGSYAAEGERVVDTPMRDDGGVMRAAESRVRCLGRCAEPRCSLLRVEPRSGRFHQVRRHVRDLGHPVIGDTDHGDSRVNRWWRQERGMGRLALHALSLALPGGVGATCPLFADMAAVLEGLPWWPEALAHEPDLGLPPITG